MKKTNIIHWVSTGLFAAFMLFSAIPDILVVQEAVTMITGLGYPTYIIPFLGVAKLLGAVAIIVPGFPRLKEWAYAGLFFDMLGATYSGICTEGMKPEIALMVLPFTVEAISYIYYHKKLRGA